MLYRDCLGGETRTVTDEPNEHVIEAKVCSYGPADTYNTTWTRSTFEEGLRNALPAMCWSHDPGNIIGGVTDWRSEEDGLYMTMRMADFDAVPDAKRAWSLIRDGFSKGWSFGFADGQAVDDPNIRGAKMIKKARMYEVSPVLRPSVPGTRTISVRSADGHEEQVNDDLGLDRAIAEGVRAALESGSDLSQVSMRFEDGQVVFERADKKPYGDVKYADPGYQKDKKKRYPLDTEQHVKAALSYINQGSNASAYSPDQLKRVKARINAAAKRMGIGDRSVRYDTSPLGSGKNWVTSVGGLPSFIRAIAHALIRNGHSEAQAIQIAVGQVKNWASGKGNVTEKTRAKAAAAVAEWEAKKAASHAKPNRSEEDAMDGERAKQHVFHYKHGWIPINMDSSTTKPASKLQTGDIVKHGNEPHIVAGVSTSHGGSQVHAELHPLRIQSGEKQPVAASTARSGSTFRLMPNQKMQIVGNAKNGGGSAPRTGPHDPSIGSPARIRKSRAEVKQAQAAYDKSPSRRNQQFLKNAKAELDMHLKASKNRSEADVDVNLIQDYIAGVRGAIEEARTALLDGGERSDLPAGVREGVDLLDAADIATDELEDELGVQLELPDPDEPDESGESSTHDDSDVDSSGDKDGEKQHDADQPGSPESTPDVPPASETDRSAGNGGTRNVDAEISRHLSSVLGW